ncbi:MAG: septum formation protein Maf [Verrucomicrobia bacterium]|nr:septum formation protein Maf [Verrucomicrobiota bacterium]
MKRFARSNRLGEKRISHHSARDGGRARVPSLDVQLVLASASPRRVELLRELCPSFDVMPTRVEEIEDSSLAPAEVALVNAWRKADALRLRRPKALILGADTVVALPKRLFGKPSNSREAVAMLKALSGRPHHVITGVCLLHPASGYTHLFAETTRVRFRRLGLASIRAYLSKIHPFDKAGGYALQEHGEAIVHSIEGSFSNVVGLPLERLASALTAFGCRRG